MRFVALVLAVGCSCAGQDGSSREAGEPRSPDRTRGEPAPPTCAPDPNVSWLDPRDRQCAADTDCAFVVANRCEMFAMSASAADRPEYRSHRCETTFGPEGPDLSTMCMCHIPLMETRCHQGCCQRRISGTPGPWLPQESGQHGSGNDHAAAAMAPRPVHPTHPRESGQFSEAGARQ